MNKGWKFGVGLSVVVVLLFMACLLVGSVRIPLAEVFLSLIHI